MSTATPAPPKPNLSPAPSPTFLAPPGTLPLGMAPTHSRGATQTPLLPASDAPRPHGLPPRPPTLGPSSPAFPFPSAPPPRFPPLPAAPSPQIPPGLSSPPGPNRLPAPTP